MTGDEDPNKMESDLVEASFKIEIIPKNDHKPEVVVNKPFQVALNRGRTMTGNVQLITFLIVLLPYSNHVSRSVRPSNKRKLVYGLVLVTSTCSRTNILSAVTTHALKSKTHLPIISSYFFKSSIFSEINPC